MASITVRRHVAADPSSVALLLAEPATDQDQDSGIVVSTPRRSGVGFTAALAVVDIVDQPLNGEVTVEPSNDAGADVVLVVAAPDGSSSRVVERIVSTYLSRLAMRARSRAFAA